MKISPVSFGSTYIVSSKNNSPEKINEVFELDYIFKKNNVSGKNKIYSLGRIDYNCNQQFFSDKHIIIDNETDELAESFFKQRNINFVKKSNEELFNHENIINRMRVPNKKYGYQRYKNGLVYVDTEKIEELFKNSNQYIGTYKYLEPYSQNRYDGFLEYIKSDMPIDAPEVYFHKYSGTPEISFQDGRHRYAVLRDMGFEKIPFAMDKESYNLIKEYGLTQ